MADVGRDQHLPLPLPLDQKLRIGQMARLEGRVDHHLVLARLQLEQLPMGQAEAPGALVVGGPVRHHVRLLGKCVQALAQRIEREGRVHRLAVGDDVQRGVSEVDDARAIRSRDVRLAHVPLVRDDPVEDPGAARDLGAHDRDLLFQDVEGGPHSVAGQAAAQGEQPAHQLVGFVSGVLGRGSGCERRVQARTALRQKNASAWELGELHSMPRSRSRLENRSSRNHCLDRWDAK